MQKRMDEHLSKCNRYNKTVVDFILGLHDVWKVPRVYC